MYRELDRIEARLGDDAQLIDTKNTRGMGPEVREIVRRIVRRRRARQKVDPVDRELEELLAERVEPRYDEVRRDTKEVLADNERLRAVLGNSDDNPGAIVEGGPSGQESGRPKLNFKGRIPSVLGPDPERWRAALSPGRPTDERKALRARLAGLIRELLETRVGYRGKRTAVSKAAIARFLKCDRGAIDDLLRQNPPTNPRNR